MKNGTYHHGNLKAELIEKGLEYIDRYGAESLSMRKLAEAAGVSCGAPYGHFKNKEACLDSVQEYITGRFSETLADTAEKCPAKERIMLDLGICYVRFFYENPLSYRFLFNGRIADYKTYPPFVFFGKTAKEWLREGGTRHHILALWSMVHGLAQMVTISGVIDTDDLENEISNIICSVKVEVNAR